LRRDPLIAGREPRSPLLRPLLRCQGVAIDKPLVSHSLPIIASDLKRITPSAHVVLESISNAPAVSLGQRGAAAGILGRKERVCAALLCTCAILLGLKSPIASRKPLLACKVSPELAALGTEATRKISGARSTAHGARRCHWRAGSHAAAGPAARTTLRHCGAGHRESEAAHA
jgi:hypothetical protein